MKRCPTTWLFVPGNRPEMFDKALHSGAEAVILDLEDAVAAERKADARRLVLEFLSQDRRDSRAVVAVRINPLDGPLGIADVLALAEAADQPDLLMVPKAEEPAELALLARILDSAGSRARLVALVESAIGIHRAAELALSTARLFALAFGAADYAADLGQQVDRFHADHARAVLVNAAAIGGVAAIDSPFFDVADPEALAVDCARARAMGFHGKAAIHPAQLPPIRDAFAASAEEREHARRILELRGKGAALLDGKMIDMAMIRWAERVA